MKTNDMKTSAKLSQMIYDLSKKFGDMHAVLDASDWKTIYDDACKIMKLAEKNLK